MDDEWDPTRIRNFMHVMGTYARHLEDGHRVRLGIEGDPCDPYRGASDEERYGTVEQLSRDGEKVDFAVRLDNGDVVRRNNYVVLGTNGWEVSPRPEDAEGFRGAVRRTVGSEVSVTDETHDALLRRVEQFDLRLRALEEQSAHDVEFRGTTAATARQLADDLMALSEGQPLRFAKSYAEQYDRVYQGQTRRYEELSQGPGTSLSDQAPGTPDRQR